MWPVRYVFQLGLLSISFSGLLFVFLFFDGWVDWRETNQNSVGCLLMPSLKRQADFPGFLALIIFFAFDLRRGQGSGHGVFLCWFLISTGSANGDPAP